MGDATLIWSAYSAPGGNYSNSEWIITLDSANLYKIENSVKTGADCISRINPDDLSLINMQPFTSPPGTSNGWALWSFVPV